MKYNIEKYFRGKTSSHLAGGGWIEIYSVRVVWFSVPSHLAGGGWIEISGGVQWDDISSSHLAGGGWIEIYCVLRLSAV